MTTTMADTTNTTTYQGMSSMLSPEKNPFVRYCCRGGQKRGQSSCCRDASDVDKNDIKVNAYDHIVEVSTTDTGARKYITIVELPLKADIELAKSSYQDNGVLEIRRFNKKASTETRGKEIKVEQ